MKELFVSEAEYLKTTECELPLRIKLRNAGFDFGKSITITPDEKRAGYVYTQKDE